MKKKFKCIAIIFFAVCICNKIYAQADQQLSNLVSPTKVSINFLPATDSAVNIGNTTKSWKSIYMKGKIFISNVPTIYTLSNSDFFAGPNAGIKLRYLNGAENTGIGAYALYYGGTDNTAVGYKSLSTDSTGVYNTAIGFISLAYNESGNENTAAGHAALYKNVNGNFNTAVGATALSANFSGDYNVAVGANALYSCYNSGSNTAVGYQSLYSASSTFNNTGLGYNSLYNCTSGFQNTAAGYNAGSNITSGEDNTFVGTNANSGSEGIIINSTALGYAASVNSDNHIRLGNTSITSIGGQVSWTSFSDERIKTNILHNVPGLAFINLLKPVTYHFSINKEQAILQQNDSLKSKNKYALEKMQFSGFLAQEVEAAAKKINYDFSGVDVPANDKDVYGLRYSDFVVPLVKAVQELSAKNDSLQNQYMVQQKINADLQQQINELKTLLASNLSTSSTALLAQNTPNPFSNSTTISYSIPQQFSSAKIIIADKNGNALKQINLSQVKGNISVDASALISETYQYSLYVNGKMTDTKQFIVSK